MKEYIKDKDNCPHVRIIHGISLCDLEVTPCEKVGHDKCKRIVRVADTGEQIGMFTEGE